MPGKFEMPGLLGLYRRCCPLGWSKKQKPVRPGYILQNWSLLISGMQCTYKSDILMRI